MDSKGLYMKYFVLNPNKSGTHGHASRMAMMEYSRIIQPVDWLLAEQLVAWVDMAEKKLQETEIERE